ncbi:MAG: PDZ domain-containing protein [Planctomycetes bacterium]|nr:PDZ domain-containing protein [Planctomycetota bacterium]
MKPITFKTCPTAALAVVGVMAAMIPAGRVCLARGKPLVPDLTAGGKPDDSHDWNLGPTGARGWIWGWGLETTDSRQILITKVDRGSPADDVLRVGDVIIGVGGRPFASDARKSLGRAITEAEKTENRGLLRLLVWRSGRRLSAVVRLPVLGDYSDTAPFDCPKSRRILDAGCRYIAGHMKGGIDGMIGALALLASGKQQYLPLVREYVHKLAPPTLKVVLRSSSGMASWHWGYRNLLLTEYYLATRDAYVLPAIRQYTINIARGQSCVGSWGHGMAWPDLNGGTLHGRLGGYGALNQAGLVCHLSMVLGRKCGVRNAEVDKAIERANRFFGFYVDKGSIPYGDHRPGWTVHDDNGKNSIAAVIFDIQGDRRAASFFSRMTVASYGERERGHTGNYFSFLWGPLGAGRAGKAAAAAFLKQMRWYFDLARRPDGSFVYQGGAGMGGGEHKYAHWDCTGAYMLAYALPLRKLYITGRGLGCAEQLTGADLRQVIQDGEGFSSWTMGIDRYRRMSDEQLLQCLRSWSPAVRHRASTALAERDGDFLPRLLAMLGSGDLHARYGACHALGALKRRAAPAVGALAKLLEARDQWLRIEASYALASIGKPARQAVPEMLKLAARDDGDDRQMTQRYLAFGLFYPGGALRMTGLISHSMDGVDMKLLYPAVEKLLQNPDGRARGAVTSVYRQLSYEQLRPILPAIYRAIKYPAPSGVMFASGVRLRGLDLLARLRIKEGIPLCLEVMDINNWGMRARIIACLNILRKYGGAAKVILPQLEELLQQLEHRRDAKSLQPQIDLLRKTIQEIRTAPPGGPLRSLNLPAGH